MALKKLILKHTHHPGIIIRASSYSFVPFVKLLRSEIGWYLFESGLRGRRLLSASSSEH